ncbi:MotA/TolQ/ExbB proton channel family protein [Flavitalea sp. BT771]|uniref:MotA/TolQ/ExbB proton channel family protein n=1 Tax=Flavitalea sp. BT771 TaxID=3063329 RepID=UPI0026E1D600|nr:MotA/TolQ/ExbB proton channel family protein [Flavitalea sp. BT771]MDO6429860.1 MotA/TolQ/ExbB proton channel family protein [Flavitalea sp. BT771]MDV6218012.1 MotA/TolQ/ExbB proton channel family protein [Flavitalea sp. BT771]
MNIFFLQVLIDSAKIKDSLARAAAMLTPQKENLWDTLSKGGILMIPLALLLVIAIFVFIERYIAIKKASRVDDNFMSIIRDHIITGNLTAARSLAKNTPTAVARLIDKGLQRVGKEIAAIERSMENVAKLELYKMEKNVSILSVVGYIAPLFGFLGTIFGMFQLFYSIASTGEYSISNIAGGIYVKMISSASGLIIGIIAYIGYRYLNSQIDKTTHKMEAAANEFIDVLQEPTR